MGTKNIFKKVSILCLALGLGLGASLTNAYINNYSYVAYAEQSSTTNGYAALGNGDAQITIRPNSSTQSLIGKKFNVYKLFDAENAKGMESINYTFNAKYKEALQNVVGEHLNKDSKDVTEYMVIDYIQTMNTNTIEGAQAQQTLEGRYSDYRYFVEELRAELVELGVEADVVTVNNTTADGNLVIVGLDYGYYVIDEVYTSGSEHSAASLVMTSTANPETEVTIKSDFPRIIKKINEDDNNTGWNDIADYEIGQTVPYKYESTIPNMNGYHSYYYAFHDIMDSALTFNEDSVAITITDPSTNEKYTLTEDEYSVLIGAVDDETFLVEIGDIKAIIDREFDSDINNLGHNVYDQTVTLTYNATLNDSAASRTGRAGFENDVYLEFSNNPDADEASQDAYEGSTLTERPSTGITPIDTVVVFTYRMNGVKVNNHNVLLSDAKLRLYSDKDCKNEVYVKAGNGGYIVINRDSLGGSDHTGGTTPTNATEMVSDSQGVFTIFGLDQGTYYLKETDSPAGYRELLDPIEIIITPTFTEARQDYVKGDGATEKTLISLAATAEVKEFLSGVFDINKSNLETNVVDGSLNITVVNTVGTKLPVTGSSTTMIMLGAGTVLSLMGIKKMKKEEE